MERWYYCQMIMHIFLINFLSFIQHRHIKCPEYSITHLQASLIVNFFPGVIPPLKGERKEGYGRVGEAVGGMDALSFSTTATQLH